MTPALAVRSAEEIRRERLVLVGVWAVWLLVSLLTSFGDVLAGQLSGNDDYMRIVEVRDLLAGRGWFDHVNPRLNPPGVEMHWSRATDVMVGGLILLAQPVLGAAGAEAFAVTAYPAALFFVTLALLVSITRQVTGRSLLGFVLLAVLLLPDVLGQYRPGRIDHHTLQVVVTLAALRWLVQAPTARTGAGVALMGALSLQIGAEAAPYAVVGFGVVAVDALRRVEGAADAGRSYAMAFAGSALVLHVLTVAPSAYLQPACDAWGLTYLAGAVAGAVVMAGIVALSSRVDDLRARFLGAGGLGLVAGVVLLLAFPECRQGPFVSVDPLVERVWLTAVSESQGIGMVLTGDPGLAVALHGYAVLGVMGSVGFAFLREREGAVWRGWAVLALFGLMALVVMMGMQRAFLFAHLFAVPATARVAAWALGIIREEERPVGVRLSAAALILLANGAGMSIVGNGVRAVAPGARAMSDAVPVVDLSPGVGPSLLEPEDCLTPAALTALDELEPTLLFGPIDLGSPLLAFTDHSVVAAPYHRNVGGLEAVIRGFVSAEATARSQVTGTGASHLVICPRYVELGVYASIGPDGLADRLRHDNVPNWLMPVPGFEGSPLEVFEVVGE